MRGDCPGEATLTRLLPFLSSVVELSGVAAIVYGVGTVSRPAAFIVGGLIAVVAAYALDRKHA